MPNSTTRYSNKPYRIRKAVYFLLPSRIRILLNVVIILSFVKYRAFTKRSSIS